ncbi:hypothetical protein NDU88_003574 [Pleurodeles waltl]|uniref:Basic proline-rich protein-like n=1 Tax=Pleurodeles waltl TaxID=8319 RepID=A0AAV7MQZ8_PLEWA|nr:hypothetical protein NDU88_003574 [Pleurodeles waltl]
MALMGRPLFSERLPRWTGLSLGRGQGPISSPGYAQHLWRVCSPTSPRRGSPGSSLIRGPRPGPTESASPSREAARARARGPPQPRGPTSGPAVLRSPGPSRRRDSPAAGSARLRSSGPSLGAPARGVRNTALGCNSPRLRPPFASPPRGAASSRANSAPLSPLGPTLSRAPSGVGFLPIFQPRVPRHPRTHKGSPRFPLRVRHGLAFRADDGGVQSTLRVQPPS